MENSDLMDDYDHLPEYTNDDRTLGTFAHLGALAGCIVPMGNIVLPLGIWITKKEESEFVDRQAKEALNFQISMMLMFLGAGILCIVLIGIPLLFALIIFDIVVSIIAATKANKGEFYQYPLNFRFIR